MKKLCAITAVIVLILSISFSVCADENYKIFLDGEEVKTDVTPVFESDEILLPGNECFEIFSCSVSYNPEDGTITAQRESTTIKMTADSYEMYLNDESAELNVCPKFNDELTMIIVPLTPIAEALDYSVNVDTENLEVCISQNIPEPSEYGIVNKDKDVILDNQLIKNNNGYYIITDII